METIWTCLLLRYLAAEPNNSRFMPPQETLAIVEPLGLKDEPTLYNLLREMQGKDLVRLSIGADNIPHVSQEATDTGLAKLSAADAKWEQSSATDLSLEYLRVQELLERSGIGHAHARTAFVCLTGRDDAVRRIRQTLRDRRWTNAIVEEPKGASSDGSILPAGYDALEKERSPASEAELIQVGAGFEVGSSPFNEAERFESLAFGRPSVLVLSSSLGAESGFRDCRDVWSYLSRTFGKGDPLLTMTAHVSDAASGGSGDAMSFSFATMRLPEGEDWRPTGRGSELSATLLTSLVRTESASEADVLLFDDGSGLLLDRLLGEEPEPARLFPRSDSSSSADPDDLVGRIDARPLLSEDEAAELWRNLELLRGVVSKLLSEDSLDVETERRYSYELKALEQECHRPGGALGGAVRAYVWSLERFIRGESGLEARVHEAENSPDEGTAAVAQAVSKLFGSVDAVQRSPDDPSKVAGAVESLAELLAVVDPDVPLDAAEYQTVVGLRWIRGAEVVDSVRTGTPLGGLGALVAAALGAGPVAAAITACISTVAAALAHGYIRSGSRAKRNGPKEMQGDN